ncbi:MULTISPECIES: hypothetical protein [unclassified Mesorhizobium]|uniref:phosphoribosyltransferase-like protein n=1 Tax=unclassified Mesorhizobium TaxID=325217 RepID=UPI00333AD706
MTTTIDLLSEKERFFRLFQVWPISQRFETERWRENFTSDERPFADRLLDRFAYFNETMVDALLKAAVQRFLNISYSTTKTDISRCVFVSVEGEAPHPADSGYAFLRKVRNTLGVNEDKIHTADSALRLHPFVENYVFVDDFVGSGNQMTQTWTRKRVQPDGSILSFADVAVSGKHTFAYCPCLCTESGKINLERDAAPLCIVPAHIISARHNAIHPEAFVWEGMNINDALQFMKTTGNRAGFVAQDGGQNDWRGYHCLGLSLAVHDSIPDASLPIYFSQLNGWKPLMRRSS